VGDNVPLIYLARHNETAWSPDVSNQISTAGYEASGTSNTSPYAMARLVGLKDQYRVAFASDTDADRRGIVTPSAGLMNPTHYLAVAIRYLLTHRPDWPAQAAVGKTLVSRKDPGEHYRELAAEFVTPYYTRIGAPATPEQKSRLERLSPEAIRESSLAGERIARKLTRAPGNDAAIGGVKVLQEIVNKALESAE
jgi:phosphoglucomutase